MKDGHPLRTAKKKRHFGKAQENFRVHNTEQVQGGGGKNKISGAAHAAPKPFFVEHCTLELEHLQLHVAFAKFLNLNLPLANMLMKKKAGGGGRAAFPNLRDPAAWVTKLRPLLCLVPNWCLEWKRGRRDGGLAVMQTFCAGRMDVHVG